MSLSTINKTARQGNRYKLQTTNKRGMASHTCILVLMVATLFVAVLGAAMDDGEAETLYQMYNDAMQKREDRSLMDFLLEKRGRGGTTRKCQHNGLTCSCDYRFGPSNSRRYVNCLKIHS